MLLASVVERVTGEKARKKANKGESRERSQVK
jgi:hypothetical protein